MMNHMEKLVLILLERIDELTKTNSDIKLSIDLLKRHNSYWKKEYDELMAKHVEALRKIHKLEFALAKDEKVEQYNYYYEVNSNAPNIIQTLSFEASSDEDA